MRTFLFLSGMGLTFSSIKNPLSIFKFYLKRLSRLFIPMWIVLTLFLTMDFFFLHTSYPLKSIWQSYLGFFTAADLFKSINSPLWYFTLILFYYLIFPLIFHRKLAYLAPMILLLLPYWLLKKSFLLEYLDINVINLYSVHFVSFPLGVFFALLIQDKNLGRLRFHFKNLFLRSNLTLLLVPIFLGVFAYTSINSGVGLEKEIEQTTSLITMFSIIFVFIAKSIEFRLFHLFGKYSYEIYLLHWPLLARYDLFYTHLPAALATGIYLAEFILLGYLLQKTTNLFFNKLSKN
jgi:peptidoglycan/LPS O-acetylase OafA/YrhL